MMNERPSEQPETEPRGLGCTAVVMHPVQRCYAPRNQESVLSSLVTMRAYEVYCALFGEQSAMVTGHCRGGFGTGELVAFLYARSFPRNEWRERFNEAMIGMRNI